MYLRILLQHFLHKSDSWPEVLYNLESGSWLAWANHTTVHYYMQPSTAIISKQLKSNHSMKITSCNQPLNCMHLHRHNAHRCEQLAQTSYLVVNWLGDKPSTSRSWIQCHNLWATKPRGTGLALDLLSNFCSLRSLAPGTLAFSFILGVLQSHVNLHNAHIPATMYWLNC